jgi:hypothetical protein
MTIRVERQALLRVINTSQSSHQKATTTSLSWKSCNPYIREEDEFVIVDSVPVKKFYSGLIPALTEEDDSSLCTLSTSSIFSSDDEITTVERRVSFAPQLVSHVWTRERTPVEDVSNLFYSAAETQTVGTVDFVRMDFLHES